MIDYGQQVISSALRKVRKDKSEKLRAEKAKRGKGTASSSGARYYDMYYGDRPHGNHSQMPSRDPIRSTLVTQLIDI
jgi:hypothetical protein